MHIHFPQLLKIAVRRRRPQLKWTRRLFLERLELRRVLAPLVSGLDPLANSHDAPLSTSIEATFPRP